MEVCILLKVYIFFVKVKKTIAKYLLIIQTLLYKKNSNEEIQQNLRNFFNSIKKANFATPPHAVQKHNTVRVRVQFACSLGCKVLSTNKLLTLTAQKTIPVPAIQKASFYSCTQLAVLAVLRACCSGCSKSLLFRLSRKLSVLAVQKAFFYCCSESWLFWLLSNASWFGCSEICLFWLYRQPPFLAVQKFDCSGCQESLLLRLSRKLPVVAVQRASCCGYLFRSFPFSLFCKLLFLAVM